MNTLRNILTTLAVALTMAASAHAQVDRPLRILVGFPAGGSADLAARLIGERMATELKQPVVIENKPGAGGRLAADVLKNAPADGSTWMLAPIVVPVLAPLVFTKLPYNASTDFAPVAPVANYQFGLAVNAAHPAKTVQELVKWAKANPMQANFGSPSPGSLPHFFGVMISHGAQLDMVHIPFNGGAPMMNALMGSQITTAIDTVVDQIEMHRAGKIRILATSGASRSPLLSDVPTFSEAGLKGVEGTGWFGVYAPAKVAPATIAQVNAAINKALAIPELRERFIRMGLEPTGGSPADLTALMKRDTERWAPVVKASGFRPD
ncbi:MAG: Bug family tripartite tricarboxylate transporter substrate binding protein [Burkholderiales bacterium]|nr:Bug family tripartite tricarboxylate transporter substrate binding protein [Burkholderiales bacterium]